MKVKFYLKDPNATNETSIYARISYGGTSLKYYTGESIRPDLWNSNDHRANRKLVGYQVFNLRLENIATKAANVARNYANSNNNKYPTTDQLKKLLDKELKNVADNTDKLLPFFAGLNKRTEKGTRMKPGKGVQYSEGTIKVYRTVYNRLSQYEDLKRKKLTFDSITLDFHDNYTKYLLSKGLSTNTIGKDIKTIKAVLSEATEAGLNTNMAFRGKRFTTPREQTEQIYLNESEIEELENLDLSDNPTLDRVRDLFVVACNTGMRFSDFSNLTAANIEGRYINFKQVKTGNPVTVPVLKSVDRILQKYNGNFPKAYSNQAMNRYLKDLGKLADSLKGIAAKGMTKGGEMQKTTYQKWELLTTHTARRSFATNCYLKKIPLPSIAKVTGHKSLASLERYIRLDNKDHAKILKEMIEPKSSTKMKAVG